MCHSSTPSPKNSSRPGVLFSVMHFFQICFKLENIILMYSLMHFFHAFHVSSAVLDPLDLSLGRKSRDPLRFIVLFELQGLHVGTQSR
jgi:hypothetical protein